jgi:hypothetical protein
VDQGALQGEAPVAHGEELAAGASDEVLEFVGGERHGVGGW